MPATTTTTAQQGQEGGGVVRGYSKCQDCGNQAKKECPYWRCRTCCKNKGFDCQTHMKSTWIPVDRRRQREEDQPSPSTTTNTNNPFHFHGGDMSKRPKKHSGVEELKFPAATNSTAIFKRVEVRSMDDVVNETAYQTSVNIGGHVFSGLLYDQGPDHHSFINSSKGDSFTLVRQQNLNSVINASSTHQTHHHDGAIVPPFSASPAAAAAPAPAPAAHDDHFLPQPYPFPLASLRPGMPYFPYPKNS